MKRMLVNYTNQLKKRWNVAEPGGIAHNPRTKLVLSQACEVNPLANLLNITLLLGAMLYFFTHFNLTSMISPNWNRPAPAGYPGAG